uniref:Uncharacterized protein n=1 Tax=Wildemania schizophylla TaxID=1134705 RepID=A0A126G1S0_WILSC|nr:hypothetical protein [Wildemania schizophylla]AKS28334.1 hypothetical protein [Wildemania schizophylla]
MLVALPIFYLSILTIFLICLSWIITKQLKTIFLLESQFKYFVDKRQNGILGADEIFAFARVCVAKKLFVNAIVESQAVLQDKSYFTIANNNDIMSKLYNMLGFIYYEAGHSAFAKNFYLRAIDMNSNYIVALNNLAKIYEDIKNFRKAEDLYQQVLKINSSNETATRRMQSISKLKNL